MQLKETEKELRFYEDENDTILKQINEILISEENKISLLLKEMNNENDCSAQIEKFFLEFDVKVYTYISIQILCISVFSSTIFLFLCLSSFNFRNNWGII